MTLRRIAWPLMVAVLLATFAVGIFGGDSTPRTSAERVQSLSTEIRCPTCQGQSVAQSEAPLAQSARQEIDRQVSAGRTDAEVREYFVSRYGPDALLDPPHSGAGLVVWLLPLGGGIAAVIGITVAVRRWQKRDAAGPQATEEDRRLVESAMR